MTENLFDIPVSILFACFVVVILLMCVLLVLSIQEQTLMLECLNNGGRWITEYAKGCTYPNG